MTRTRHVTHSRTTARLEKIRKLIAALQLGQLMREDIANLLQLSPSGVRKYIADLREAGVMEIARFVDGTATFLGYPEYRLTPDFSRVQDYLAALDAAPVCARKEKTSELVQAQRNPSRHFHILADDEHYAIRVSRAPAAPDPMALPPAFFARTAGREARA